MIDPLPHRSSINKMLREMIRDTPDAASDARWLAMASILASICDSLGVDRERTWTDE